MVNLEHYAAELDAVDASISKSVAAHDGITLISPWGWGDPIVVNSVVVGTNRRPVAPVSITDPARVAVAVLQRLYFERKAAFCGSDLCHDSAPTYILLAMADRLLMRRLKLSPSIGADLI